MTTVCHAALRAGTGTGRHREFKEAAEVMMAAEWVEKKLLLSTLSCKIVEAVKIVRIGDNPSTNEEVK
jgi:hypothetical protein